MINDLELLRQYEPILYFTSGELFYPCAVDGYVRRSSLWLWHKNSPDELLVPHGALTTAALVDYSQREEGQSLYMRFVRDPLIGRAFQRWLRRKDRPRFRAPGRLARVGLLSRMIDTGFDLSLFLRGKVPGGTVAAAEEQYRAMYAEDPRYVYYGRVVRENGYIVLQYLFFYAMNNWRTSYYGMNDHEADWEQVLIYLAEQPHAEPTPIWVACASHDYVGDDLRRRWDDMTDLQRDGNHPIVYVGAGSHANYFEAGEYLGYITLPLLRPISYAVEQLITLWRFRFGQGRHPERQNFISNLIRLPFIDYARGDGRSIGPNQSWEWSPIMISEGVDWIQHYRGLWGLDLRDPFKGENAPSGPKYNRDGTLRMTWHNPLGWAGLHKVPPPPRMIDTLRTRIQQLQRELGDIETQMESLRERLPKLNLEVTALRRVDYLSEQYKAQEKRLIEAEETLNTLYAERATLHDSLRACQEYLLDLEHGKIDPPQAHLRRQHKPLSPSEIQQNTLLESWAALSAGILMLGFAVTVLIDRSWWISALAGIAVMYAVIETALRRRLQNLLLSISVILGMMTSLVLIYEFFWEAVLVNVLAIAILIITTNWRELRGS